MLGFLACAPVGMFTARYKKLFGEVWFIRHLTAMISCLICVLIAFVLILVHTKGWPEAASTHHYLGVFAVIVFAVQPLMALARPAPTHPRRWIFTWAHRIVGVVGWLLGAVAAAAGVAMFELDWGLMVAFIVVTVLLFVAVDVYLATRQEKDGETATGDGTAPAEVTKSGRVGGYVVMGVVFLFAVVVIIYYIVVLNKDGGHSHGGH